MTNNEIIKALECCDGTLAGCTECPNYKNRFCCEIEGEALDLINRQKAEIERLKAMNQAKLDIIHDLRERLGE